MKRAYHKLYNSNDKINDKINGSNYREAIKELYKDRVAPVKVFDRSKIIATCFNFLNLKERSLFLPGPPWS